MKGEALGLLVCALIVAGFWGTRMTGEEIVLSVCAFVVVVVVVVIMAWLFDEN